MSIFIPPKINNEQLSKIILEKGQIVFNESDDKFYTGNGEVGGEKINKDVPTKTSELVNDSGFITVDEIPPVQIEESDPIYTADKPNLALKSELFSKDYNDLTNKPSIPSIQGLASEQYVNEKIADVKVPSKTSELTNDSGFISEIPQNLVTEQELDNKGYLTSFTQSDPVYSKDKPNLALKSELFSKSYNDLTDKPELYQPKADGDGSKFLSDDGTYKTVQGGGSAGGSVDLSNYTGNVNFKYDSGNSYLKTSNKNFSIGTDPVNYTSQMDSANINGGNLINYTANIHRFMDGGAYNTNMMIQNGNVNIYGALFVNGSQIGGGMNEDWIYANYAEITTSNNSYLEVYYEGDYKLTDMTLNFEKVDNWMFHLITGDSFNYTINMYFNAFINKPFDFQPNKEYLIMSHKNIIIWNQIQRYNSGE